MPFSRFLLVLILTCTNAYSQTYFSQNFGLDNGLPSDEVYSIYKDTKGYLWVGTNAGVARYNGSEFTCYNTSHGLAGDRVWAIAEDSKNNIFFGCYGGGISIFDGKIFKIFNAQNGLVNNNVRAFHYSTKSKLMFIATDAGLSVYDGASFQNFSIDNGTLKEQALFSSFIEKSDTVFCFTFTGYNFYYYLLSQRKLKLLPHTHIYYKYNSRTCAALESGQSTILGVEKSGIKIIKDDNVQVYENMGQIFGLTTDNRKQVWAAAWSYMDMKEPGGLFVYDGKNLRNLSHELGINSRFGWAVCFDKSSGAIWYGTNDNGLYKIQESPVKYYNTSFFKSSELKNNAIYADRDNNIWIGTNNNVYILNDSILKVIESKPFEDEFKRWFTKNFTAQYAFLNDQKGTFEKYESLRMLGRYKYPNPYRYVRAGKYIYRSHNERPWTPKPKEEFEGFIGFGYDMNHNFMILTTNGLYNINKKGEPKFFTTVNYSSPRPNFIFDSNNNLHMVGWGWLTISHNSENHQDLFQPDFKKEPSPRDISQLQVRGNEVWYAGMHNGLYCCLNDSFQNFNSSNSEIPNVLNGLVIDKDGRIIIGGNNGHIYIAEYNGKKFQLLFDFSEKDGVMGSTINWLLIDSKNNLWFGTNKGLNQLDLNSLYRTGKVIIRNYNQEEGFDDYSGKFATIDLNDKIWIAAKNQIVRIDTRKLQKIQLNKSTIRLSGLDVNYESETIPSSLKFPYYKNTLTFYIEKLNFLNPNKDLFRYRIEGKNSNWSKYSKDRKITVNKLPPGKYIIRIESINTSDPSTNIQSSLICTITPPFWRTWWFTSIATIILIAGIYFTYRVRIKRLNALNLAQLGIQKRIHDLEMQALQAQMNPHFTFNALCSVQNYILEKDVESALSFLNDFAKLIRLTMHNASQKSILLSEEIDYLKTYINLEKKRLSGRFSENFEIDRTIDPEELRIPPMLIQPFVENAIKHGLMHKKEGGVIKISFKYLVDGSLFCSVEDNGIGRIRAGEISVKRPEHHNGKGTEITKNRIELFNTGSIPKYQMTIIDLLDNYSNPIGTKVELVIPYT